MWGMLYGAGFMGLVSLLRGHELTIGSAGATSARGWLVFSSVLAQRRSDAVGTDWREPGGLCYSDLSALCLDDFHLCRRLPVVGWPLWAPLVLAGIVLINLRAACAWYCNISVLRRSPVIRSAR